MMSCTGVNKEGDYGRTRDPGRTRDRGQSPKKGISLVTTITKAIDSLKNAGRSKTPPPQRTSNGPDFPSHLLIHQSGPIPQLRPIHHSGPIYESGRGPMITLQPASKLKDTRNQPASSSRGDRNGSRDLSSYHFRPPPPGSYQDADTGPSPKNLVMAVMGVKSAVNHFAKALILDMIKYPDELGQLKQRIQVQGEMDRAKHWKFLVQAFVCKRLFEGFEAGNGFFGIEFFDAFEMTSVNSFHDFSIFKDKAATISWLLAKDSADCSFLGKFCFKKFKSISGDLVSNYPFALYEEEWSMVERERHPQSEFYQSFLKVAVSVWLLHRLVHSFEQGWSMLGWETFPKGCRFQRTSMESVVPGGYEEDDDETGTDVNTVIGFLVIPGFQVSKSVVKCEVYLRIKNNLIDGRIIVANDVTAEKSFSDKKLGILRTPGSFKSSSNCSGCLNKSARDSEAKVWDSLEVGNAGVVAKLESYRKVAEESTEAVRKISESLKFNNGQCEYLADKLKVAVQSASSFLKVLRREPQVSFSFKGSAGLAEIFKLLVAMAKQTESIVEGCCKDAWIQAAMTLTNVSEYVSSVGFNLELCTVVLCMEGAASGCLTLDEVDGINKAESELVGKKASVDARLLLEKVISELNSLHGENRDLASYLLRRLLRINCHPTSDNGAFWRKLFGLVESAEQVGRGASATVYRAMWLGTPVAKKTYKGSKNVEFDKEVEILSRLCHPSVTSMFCCAKNQRNCSIIMELMDGDLAHLMERRWEGCEGNNSPPFSILEAVDLMLQIGEGVNYLHNQGIVHRDLKAKNILYNNLKAKNLEIGYVHAKVTDFGISKSRDRSTTYSDLTLNTGTNRWMPPEIIGLCVINQGDLLSSSSELPKHPFKLDSYSFGMVCYEILTGDEPFSDSSNPNDIKRRIMNNERPVLPSDCPPKLKALIEKCWSQEPKERPTFAVICGELKYLKYLLMTGELVQHASIQTPAIEVPTSEVPSREKSLEKSFSDKTPARYLTPERLFRT